MIKGGYVLFSRKTLNSKIMEAPPLTFKLWGWMLLKADWKSNWKYKAGKFETSIKKMQKAMTYYVGARKEIPSISQIKTAYLFLANLGMILHSKRSYGMAITICNYNKYQDPNNYESLNESLNESLTPENTVSIPQSGTHFDTYGNVFETLTEKTRPASDINALEENKTQRIADPIAHPYNNKNIQQYNSICTSMYVLPEPENNEAEFERDRRLFFDSFNGMKTFQLFDDRPKKDKSLIKIFHVEDLMPVKYTMRLEELNQIGAGIYMCINETNGKGRKATDVIKIRSAFADFDDTPLPENFEYEPSMIIETSPDKFHVYYFSEDIPIDGFSQLQKAIAYNFKSDPIVHDLPRIMRVPGFHHNKKEPFLSRVVQHSGNIYTFDHLTEIFPPEPRKQFSSLKYQKSSFDQDSEFKGTYGASKGGRNNHLAVRIGGMLKRNLPWDQIREEAFKEGSACSPPLSNMEISSVLKSMRRY